MASLLSQRPTISQFWGLCQQIPGGRRIFSRSLGRLAPYTGTIDCLVEELRAGHSVVSMRDRHKVRNHLSSVHAIALMNLGEVSTGLAVLVGVDGRGRGIIKHLAMDYVKKARGTIVATCDVAVPDGPGSHDFEVEAILRDAEGAIVARARAVWKIDIDR
jgi:acyl-coenzyme A thioesterase PaaI-like protein